MFWRMVSLKGIDVTRRVLTLINLILITAGVFFSVQIFYGIILIDHDYISKPSEKHRPQRPVRKASIFPITYYHLIKERNLFGLKPELGKKRDDRPVKELANTDLNIRLWGTITGKDGLAYAVIEPRQMQNRRSEQQLFKEGEKVLNAEIEKVYRDKVILNMAGEQQVLEMEKYQSMAPSRRLRRSTRQPVRLTRTIHRSEIEESFQNINEIMRQVLIRPRSDGMLVSRIKRGSIFQRLGLRNGDIINGIDGKQIRSVDDALNFYNRLKSDASVRLELKRRGRPYTITYRIR
jgi:general secretion pathway protein C